MNYSYYPDHQLSLNNHATMSMSRAYTDLNDSVISDSVQYSPVNANQNLATMLASSPYHTIPQYQPQTEFLPYMPSQVHNNFYMTPGYSPVMQQPSYFPYYGQQSYYYYYSCCCCCCYSQFPPPPQVMGYYCQVCWMHQYDVRPSPSLGPAYDDDLVDDDYDLVSEFSIESFDDYEDFLELQELMGRVSVGLSKETISKKLKTSPVKDIEEDGELCAVCQDDYKLKETIATLECGHRYHANCINQWLLQKNECPICKAKAVIT